MNCERYKLYFIDYIDGKLPFQSYNEINNHLRECKSCREEVDKLKETINFIKKESDNYLFPDNFLNDIKDNISRRQFIRKKNRRRFKASIAIAIVLTLFATLTFASENFRGIINFGIKDSNIQNITLNEDIDTSYFEKLDLSVIDQDIKITITGVIADEMQIQIFYEIEDLRELTQYIPDENSIHVDGSLMSQMAYSTDTKYIQKGSLLIEPENEQTNIALKFTRLEDTGYKRETILGNWGLIVPVKKYAPKTYDLGENIEINGNNIVFEKLTMSPTSTVLSYKYSVDNKEEKFVGFNSVQLVANNKIYHSSFEPFGLLQYASDGWKYNEIRFDSMFFDNVDEIEIRCLQYTYYKSNKKEYRLKTDNENSQEIEYMGSKICIGRFEEGETIKLQMKESLKNREYQILDLYFVNSEGKIISREDEIEGFFVYKSKFGSKLYNYKQALENWNKIKGSKFYSTSHDIKLYMNAEGLDNIPSKLIIEGYYKTYNISRKINVNLNHQ